MCERAMHEVASVAGAEWTRERRSEDHAQGLPIKTPRPMNKFRESLIQDGKITCLFSVTSNLTFSFLFNYEVGNKAW